MVKMAKESRWNDADCLTDFEKYDTCWFIFSECIKSYDLAESTFQHFRRWDFISCTLEPETLKTEAEIMC